MESLSLFVQHYEFPNLFFEPFQWFLSDDQVRKAERHVKKRSDDACERRLPRWRKRDHVWWRATRGVRELLSRSLGSLVNPGHTDERKEVVMSARKQGATRLKFRSQIFSSESTREGSSSRQETGTKRNQTPKRSEENPPGHKENMLHAHQSSETWNTQTIDTRTRSFKIWRRSWECLQSTQHFQWMHNKTNVLTWRLFAASSKAAAHLGPDFLTSSEVFKKTKFKNIWSVFNITQKLVMEHSEEILNVKCLEFSSPSWARSVLANHQAIKWGESVLCVGQMNDSPGGNRKMVRSSGRIWLYSSYQDAVGYRWRSQLNSSGICSQDFHHCLFFKESSKTCREGTSSPRRLKDLGIIFMSMFNDVEWKTNDENCFSNAEKVKNYAMRFSQRTLDILGSRVGREVVWKFFLRSKKENGINSTANKIVQRFKEIGHLVLKKYQCFETFSWSKKKGGELVSSIRFDRRRKGTNEFSCGQEDCDQFETGRSTTLGIPSDNSTWKQNARKRFELRSADR